MTAPAALAPLPYHREVRDYLKANEPELWAWFTSAHTKENYAEELRLGLLKSTYRLSPDSHPDLYQHAANAARALGLEIPVFLYQAQSGSSEINAAIFYLPAEAHLVLSGPIASLLDPVELTSVLGHELAHYHLWQVEKEEFLIADRILHAVTSDPQAGAVHHETARRYRLNTEIFADRGAAHVVQNLPKVVSALVKTTTGLASVDGDSYLAQAAEIFGKGAVRTDRLSHPESFIRAHALALWTRAGDATDEAVSAIIAGEPDLRSLDLIGQQTLTALTRRFLSQLLRPTWFQSPAILGNARLYFADFAPAEKPDDALIAELHATGSLLDDYFAYLLLDFAHADRDLDDVPLAAALRWAEQLGIAAQVENLAQKELGVKPRELAKLKPRITDLLALAEKGV
jgi:hypothetical protein